MDPIDITYNDEVGFLDDKKRDWQDWIMKLLLLAKKEIGKDNNLEMSINFVDEDRSHEINLKYRDKDRPTDVISFAIEDGEDSIDLAAFEDDPDFQEDIGDLFMCPSVIKRHSKEYGTGFDLPTFGRPTKATKPDLNFFSSIIYLCLHLIDLDIVVSRSLQAPFLECQTFL